MIRKLPDIPDNILEETDYDFGYAYNLDDIEYAEKEFDIEIANAFEKDIRKFLNYIISLDNVLTEEFTSPQNLRDHFDKHCLGHYRNRRSTRNRIFYDFNDNSKYVEYEHEISNKIRETTYIIDSLYDYDTILRYMRKLFEGNITVMFANSCGLNNGRPINLSFHAYATNVTTNYIGGNTVDVCIKSGNGKTITLYTVDAHAVERKLNSIIGNYSDYNGHFGINN